MTFSAVTEKQYIIIYTYESLSQIIQKPVLNRKFHVLSLAKTYFFVTFASQKLKYKK